MSGASPSCSLYVKLNPQRGFCLYFLARRGLARGGSSEPAQRQSSRGFGVALKDTLATLEVSDPARRAGAAHRNPPAEPPVAVTLRLCYPAFPKSLLPFAFALFHAGLIRARYLADGLRDTLHQLSAHDKRSVIGGIPLPGGAPGRGRD